MVVARNEETGVSGIFPVTALMSRTSPSVIWLTLENAAGETTRMGVTSEHPLFVADAGWTNADEVAVGDQIRDADLRPLTVLAVEVDDRPQRVHNLEIAEAHTYFAGELEAWGHNAYQRRYAAKRINCKSRKEARERATRAGKGATPIHMTDGKYGPRYKPGVKNSCSQTPKQPNNHDHYYYPKGK